ncbi:MAG: DNA recombination protein RmuC [Acidimicrobiales bacterium]|jgi:DNA recombination protein RmuC|nr:DNA recombination protein RmuC [Acidimicrobiales bacterium]
MDPALFVLLLLVLLLGAAVVALLVRERHATVASAVDVAVKVAGSRLDGQLQAGTREMDLRSRSFEQQLAGITGELRRVGELVTALQRDRARQHGEVVEGLTRAARATADLGRTADALREALASPKARGQWGERMADDVLRLAGFQEGVNYRRQKADANGRIPDFTFLLPRGLVLHMDVKFPIDNYLRWLDAAHDAERERRRQDFVRDVRARVKELTTREYVDAGRTVDAVVLFIPNEAVYGFIHENDPRLLDDALRQKVVLCSPATLFAVLAVVRQAVDNFALDRRSDEILTCLARFGAQWTRFTEQLDRVDRSLQAAGKAFEDLNGTRRRQLERELGRVEALQAERAEPDEIVLPEAGEASGPARLPEHAPLA